MENWLYDDEAETANKSTFISKLAELQKFGEPAAERLREEEERPDAYKDLEKVLVEYGNLAASQDKAYEHIDAEARGKVKACVDEVSAWMSSMKAAQEAKGKTEEIACKCKDIDSKRDHVIFTCRPIMNKPKPKPVVTEPAPAPAADADSKAPADGPAPAEPTGTDAPNADAPMEGADGSAPPAGDAMDVGLD
jgi:heat shock protein 4